MGISRDSWTQSSVWTCAPRIEDLNGIFLFFLLYNSMVCSAQANSLSNGDALPPPRRLPENPSSLESTPDRKHVRMRYQKVIAWIDLICIMTRSIKFVRAFENGVLAFLWEFEICGELCAKNVEMVFINSRQKVHTTHVYCSIVLTWKMDCTTVHAIFSTYSAVDLLDSLGCQDWVQN